MKYCTVILFLLALAACGGPEPRRPVKVKSGSFFTESVERSKKLLAKEEEAIQKIIARDTANSYSNSASGFWYYLETKSDTATYQPKTNDEVFIVYNIMSLNNDTIYTRDDIGVKQLLVDKEQLFPGMRDAIKLLSEGEQATFLFPSSLAYGYPGDGDRIGPATPIKVSLRLLKINSTNQNRN